MNRQISPVPSGMVSTPSPSWAQRARALESPLAQKQTGTSIRIPMPSPMESPILLSHYYHHGLYAGKDIHSLVSSSLPDLDQVIQETPTKSHVMRQLPVSNPTYPIEIDLRSSSQPFDAPEDTPMKSQAGAHAKEPKAIILGLSSEADMGVIAITKQSQDIGEQAPADPMRSLSVAFTLYLPKEADLMKGPSKSKKKVAYSAISLPTTNQTFDTNGESITHLKSRLFRIASEIDTSDDDNCGNVAILKTADAKNLVIISGHVKQHEEFAKGKEVPLSSNADVARFFKAVRGSPLKECGFTVTMENPQKSAQEAEDAVLKKKARLRAQNEIDNVNTTPNDLARCRPADPVTKALKSLQMRHSSMKTNNNKGYRIFNKADLSQKMDLTFRHMILWARLLADNTKDVTIDDPPPDHEEFVWKDITLPKRPHQSTPLPEPKRHKPIEDRPYVRPGSYAEMQGTHITINFDTLQRVQFRNTLDDYLAYCDLSNKASKEVATILMAYGVTGFHYFLFPEVMNVRDVQAWGISWASAIELFTQSRRFYLAAVENEERRLAKGKGRADCPTIDSDDD